MQSNAKSQSVLYDGFYTLVLRLANMGAALAVGVLTARILGPAGKGVYTLPIVQAGIVSTLFTGLTSSTTYHLLNGHARRGIVTTMTIATVLFVAAASIAVFLIALASHALWAAPAAIASLPSAAMWNVVTGYVIGIRRVRYATTITLAITLLTFAVTATGFYAIGRTVPVAVGAWIAGQTVISVVVWIAMLVHARTLQPGDPIDFGSYVRLALKAGATNLVSLLNYRADLYLVAIMLPPIDLGLYSVATSAPQSLLVPTQVAALVTSPHIGTMEKPAAARLAARCVRNNLLMAVALCALLFAFAPWVVNLFYGAAFVPLVPSLRILLIGVVVLSLGSPISSYYTLKLAKPEIPLILAAISAAICIAGTVVLIPGFGIAGAATASTIAYFVGQGLGLWYFARDTGIAWRTILVPTREDILVYFDFTKRIYRDGARFFAPRLKTTGE